MKQRIGRFLGGWKMLVVVAICLHFVVAIVTGFSVDEAHYALYATHPALSYFDHPPMVGWLQIPLQWINSSPAFMRLLPQLLWIFDVLLIYSLANRLTVNSEESIEVTGAIDKKKTTHTEIIKNSEGVWAVIVFSLSLYQHVLAVGLLPDTLLTFATLGAAHVTLNLLDEDDKNKGKQIGQWLLLGVILGFAGLSKYTAILPALAIVVCLLTANPKKTVSSCGAYLAMLMAILMVLPVFIWNYEHQWISFKYQMNHGGGGSWSISNEARFLVLQLLSFGWLPLWSLLSLKNCQTRKRLFLLVGFPFFFMAVFAASGSNLPYWTAPSWALACAFSGSILTQWWGGKGWRRNIIQISLAIQGTLVLGSIVLVLTAGLPFSSGQTVGNGNAEHPSNALADFYGWSEAGGKAKKLAGQYGLSSLAVQNWTLASRLAWYAKPLPVHVLTSGETQFSLWFGPLSDNGNTLLVNWSQLDYALPIESDGFKTCLLVGRYDVYRLTQVISYFHFYACYGWQNREPFNPKLTTIF